MPLITLTSDIGQHDFLTGAVKGKLYTHNPESTIVDISHQISPFNYLQAAYVCSNVIQNFPKGTFHLVLINLFDRKTNHLLLAEHNGQYLACADNGILTMILEELPQKVVAIEMDKSAKRDTLYCVSLFAKAFQQINDGVALEKIGNKDIDIQVKNPMKPMYGSDWIEGQIIFIDNFENVIVNITREDFETQRKGRDFKIVFKRDETIDQISESYADVQDGEKLALFNAAGYLEIAINKGNAAGLFGLQNYSDSTKQSHQQYLNSRLFYQTIKVYFQ
jgi:S-adenosylmethionine hydrolase